MYTNINAALSNIMTAYTLIANVFAYFSPAYTKITGSRVSKIVAAYTKISGVNTKIAYTSILGKCEDGPRFLYTLKNASFYVEILVHLVEIVEIYGKSLGNCRKIERI